mmetsp:Transcript_55320/g.103771  ORF Transcript_55320/g.103771 Transcript_55320/m.103771 type:complete len:563 (-) Transcript_55320:39-1727(-)
MQRRQCVALCFVFLLAGADAARVRETANVMDALVMYGQKISQETHGESRSWSATSSNLIDLAPRESLITHLKALNASTGDVMKGKTLFGLKYCMLSCPLAWVKIIYHQWSARSNAKAVVSQAFAAGKSLSMLSSVSEPLSATFTATMQRTVWTFLKAIDNSILQRVLLTIFFTPLGLFRVLTKMSPLGLCFLKQAWAELEAAEGYTQKHPQWWSFFLMGCPDVPAIKGSPIPAFADEDSASDVLNGMVYALSKPEGLESEEVKWRSASTHVQCVKKLGRNGEWSKRRITIEKGLITWTADPACHDVDFMDRVGEFFGHKKSFAIEFLTTPPGTETVNIYNDSTCIAMQNPHRQFKFCAEKGYTMVKAKEVIDEHLGVLGEERQLLQMSAKVERLIVAAGIEGDDKEVEKLGEDMAADGDSNTDGLAAQIGDISSESQTPESKSAELILKQVSKGSSLISAGEVHEGTALLQEAYAAAHTNAQLADLIRARHAALHGRNSLVDAGATAGTAGGITTTELLILLIICGSMLCLAVGAVAMSANLEVDSKIIQVTNSTLTMPPFA